MTAPLDLSQRLGLWKHLTTVLEKLHKDGLVPDAQAAWPSGTRMPLMFGGKHAGWANMPEASKKSAHVSEPAKLLAWTQVHYPAKVATTETVEVTPELLAHLREHFPDAIVRTRQPDPQWVADVCKALAESGRYATITGDKLTEVPGITVSEPKAPVPHVNLDKEHGAEIIGAALLAREIPVAELLALPGGPPVSEGTP